VLLEISVDRDAALKQERDFSSNGANFQEGFIGRNSEREILCINHIMQ
jgi:hypothetical protein